MNLILMTNFSSIADFRKIIMSDTHEFVLALRDQMSKIHHLSNVKDDEAPSISTIFKTIDILCGLICDTLAKCIQLSRQTPTFSPDVVLQLQAALRKLKHYEAQQANANIQNLKPIETVMPQFQTDSDTSQLSPISSSPGSLTPRGRKRRPKTNGVRSISFNQYHIDASRASLHDDSNDKSAESLPPSPKRSYSEGLFTIGENNNSIYEELHFPDDYNNLDSLQILESREREDKEDILRLEEELQESKKEIEHLKKMNKSLTENISRLEKSLQTVEHLETQLHEKNEALTKLEDFNVELRKSRSQVKLELNEANDVRYKQNEEMEQLKLESENLRYENEQTKKTAQDFIAITESNEEIEDLQRQIVREKENEICSLKSELQRKSAELIEAKGNLDDNIKQNKISKNKLASVEEQLMLARLEVSTKTEEITLLKSQIPKSIRNFKPIREEKKPNRIYDLQDSYESDNSIGRNILHNLLYDFRQQPAAEEFIWLLLISIVISVGFLILWKWLWNNRNPNNSLGAFGMGGPEFDNWLTRVLNKMIQIFGPRRIIPT